MTTPPWVDNRIQPIAIRDVPRYLVASATMAPAVSRGFDIGGPEALTYREMMQRYAAAAGLPRRIIVGVGVLTPRLSSLWVSLVTPVPSGLARPLVQSLVHEVVCDEHDIADHVPDPPGGLLPFDTSVRLALQRIQEAVDFWRVEEIDPPRPLRLRTEMRVPGLAWPDLVVEPGPDPERCTLRQVATFHLHGLAGQVYWWSVAPFHGWCSGAGSAG